MSALTKAELDLFAGLHPYRICEPGELHAVERMRARSRRSSMKFTQKKGHEATKTETENEGMSTEGDENA